MPIPLNPTTTFEPQAKQIRPAIDYLPRNESKNQTIANVTTKDTSIPKSITPKESNASVSKKPNKKLGNTKLGVLAGIGTASALATWGANKYMASKNKKPTEQPIQEYKTNVKFNDNGEQRDQQYMSCMKSASPNSSPDRPMRKKKKPRSKRKRPLVRPTIF